MRTPDLHFTSTNIPIRALHRSTTIHIKERLLFSSTNTCWGGLHRWRGHWDQAALTNSQHFPSGKEKCEQQIKSAVGTGSSTKHRLSLALPLCISYSFLRCFPSGILVSCLPPAAPINVWYSSRNIEGWALLLTCPHTGPSACHLLVQGQLRRHAGECGQLGHLMAALRSCLHFFHPYLAYAYTRHYSRGTACSASSQLRLRTADMPERNTGCPRSGTLAANAAGTVRPDPDPAIPAAAEQKAVLCSLCSPSVDSLPCLGYPAPIHGCAALTGRGSPAITTRHLLQTLLLQIPSWL